jgi:hypothetical protein
VPAKFTGGHARAVYTRDWCYVEYYGTEIRELYRLETDQHGYFNLADRHPEIVAAHARLLHDYFPLDRRMPKSTPVQKGKP